MRRPATLLALCAIASAAAAADDPATLAADAGCGNCHKAAQPMLGPSWEAIAGRYAGKEDAAATLQSRMREGVQGIWGQAPMPPVTPQQLDDGELATVTDWILNR